MIFDGPAHVVLVNRSTVLDDRDMAFMGEAARLQLADVAAAYGWPRPGVSVCTADIELPAEKAVLVVFHDDDGYDDSLGYHGVIGGYPYAVVGAAEAPPSVIGSHEWVEMYANLMIEQWCTAADGSRWPRELCDAVQSDTYQITVELFGERRRVAVSDWVLPSYWQPGSAGPWDHLGRLHGPFDIAPGGYSLVERNGVADFVFGADAGDDRGPSLRTLQLRAEKRLGLR